MEDQKISNEVKAIVKMVEEKFSKTKVKLKVEKYGDDVVIFAVRVFLDMKEDGRGPYHAGYMNGVGMADTKYTHISIHDAVNSFWKLYNQDFHSKMITKEDANKGA